MNQKATVKKSMWILGGIVLLLSAANGFAAPDTTLAVSKEEEKPIEGFSPLAPEGQEAFAKEVSISSDRISLDLRSIEISEALRFLATRAKLNMVISKSVAGRLFLVLNDVPIKDVLDIIVLSSGLAYDKQGEIYQIMTGDEYKTKYGRNFSDSRQVKIFRLQYAAPDNVFSAIEVFKSEIGRILVDKESGMVLVMETPANIAEIEKVISTLDQKRTVRSFSLQYAKAKDVEERLKAQIGDKGGGTVHADERTNQIIVEAFPGRMDQLVALIKSLDQKTKEVLIVSKIIKVALEDNFEAEIQWEGLFRNFNLLPGFDQGGAGSHELDPLARAGTSFVDEFLPFIGTPTTAGSLTRPPQGAKVYPTESIVFGQSGTKGGYEVLFKFLQTLGETRVLSSPRITVVNNQEAKLHVGAREMYVTSTTTTGSGSAGNTVAQAVNFIDVGIELSVTPTINDDGFVTMKIKPSISNVKRYDEVTNAGETNRIPIIDTSEAETTVMVKDRTSIVIAGLRTDEFANADKQIPYFSKLPLFGSLFKSGSKDKKRTEVIILLTPYINGGENLVTGELSGPGPTTSADDFRGYSSLTLDKNIRTGESSGVVTKLIKKLPFTSHD